MKKLTKFWAIRLAVVCLVVLVLAGTVVWYLNPVLSHWTEEKQMPSIVTKIERIYWNSTVIVNVVLSPFNYTRLGVGSQGTLYSSEASYLTYSESGDFRNNQANTFADTPFLVAAGIATAPSYLKTVSEWTVLMVYPSEDTSSPFILTIDRKVYSSYAEGKFRIEFQDIVDLTHADIEIASLLPHTQRLTLVVQYVIGVCQVGQVQVDAIWKCEYLRSLQDIVKGTTTSSCRVSEFLGRV